MRLSAKQARTLAVRSLDNKLDDICFAIGECAKRGETTLKTCDYSKDKEFWSYLSREWGEAEEVLRDLGYSVYFSHEKQCTIIEWG